MAVSALHPLETWMHHTTKSSSERVQLWAFSRCTPGWLYFMMMIWIIHVWSRQSKNKWEFLLYWLGRHLGETFGFLPSTEITFCCSGMFYKTSEKRSYLMTQHTSSSGKHLITGRCSEHWSPDLKYWVHPWSVRLAWIFHRSCVLDFDLKDFCLS